MNMDHPTKTRTLLLFCSCFDIIYSTAQMIFVGLHVATCQVEDETVINHQITLERIEYFYDALKDCGYKEESHIPSTEKICTMLETRVMPWAGLSLALNFVLGVFIQIMIHDSHFFLDKEYHKYSRPVSLISVPIGTLVAMSLASIALAEYTNQRLCWLSYSITEQRRSYSYQVAIILVPIILAVYKPLELGIFYLYACSIFREDESEDVHKINLDTQMHENTETNETPAPHVDT